MSKALAYIRFRNCAASGADHLDLAERGGIEHAAAGRTARHSRADRRMHVLAGLREVAGALPLADVLEHGAVRHGPARGSACAGPDRTAPPAAGQRAEGDRRIGHAERRESDLRRSACRAPAATIPRAFILDVLPWSVAMPVVV